MALQRGSRPPDPAGDATLDCHRGRFPDCRRGRQRRPDCPLVVARTPLRSPARPLLPPVDTVRLPPVDPVRSSQQFVAPGSSLIRLDLPEPCGYAALYLGADG